MREGNRLSSVITAALGGRNRHRALDEPTLQCLLFVTLMAEILRGISCHQRPSEAIRGYQRSSEAIRAHQRPSETYQFLNVIQAALELGARLERTQLPRNVRPEQRLTNTQPSTEGSHEARTERIGRSAR